jgi:hypothetical protein
MRRSTQVLAPLLASAAVALLSGCRTTEMQRCVDENNHVADPNLCSATSPSGGAYGGGHIYRYYYGGGGNYAPGSTVTGGSYTPQSGHSYSTTTGTARGGFGSSFGGGDGGEGGGDGGSGE